MAEIVNQELKLAFDFVTHTDKSIFLTGKAGTGKTTFLHKLKKISPKRMIVVAPTGVAAINAGGVTIHSFFQMPFGPYLPDGHWGQSSFPAQSGANARIRKFSREKRNIIKSLDLLIIDEISMVRADLLDGVDDVLRRYRHRDLPFGGVQLLMIGDLHQLAPIVKDDEWQLLRPYYDSCFFFSSRALNEIDYVKIELKKIYRQNDGHFIDILNQIRENRLGANVLERLNQRCDPMFDPGEEAGYITLTTHNAQAHEINNRKLNKLPARVHRFTAKAKGDFPEYAYPTEFELKLKRGTQVMFVKNDNSPEKRYYNGKIGRITGFQEDKVRVSCPGDPEEIHVQKVDWHNLKYTIDPETKEIKETIAGTFSQYPLKMAWAITIHKSQGLTFEKAIIDARAAFAYGQVYVALSRLKTLDGLVLCSPIMPQGMISDPIVEQFTRSIAKELPDEALFNQSRKSFQQTLLMSLFGFKELQTRLYDYRKLFREHQRQLQISFDKELTEMIEPYNRDVVAVSEKFHRQLGQLLPLFPSAEENPQLQDRVRKACNYFIEKIDTLITEPLGQVAVETDNRQILKLFEDSFQRLQKALTVKRECLKACRNGFSADKLLKARAAAIIVQSSKKSANSTGKPSFTDRKVEHPLLYARLKAWRSEQAAAQDIPHYLILHQKTAVEIASRLPLTKTALKGIKGIGKMKLKQYGDDIIKIVKDYYEEKRPEISPPAENRETEKKPAMRGSSPKEEAHTSGSQKEKKPNSLEISFNLFIEGYSVDEIAARRELHVKTIEGHLAHFVGTGQLAVDKLVPDEKKDLIADCFTNSKTKFLKPVKEKLGDQVSYTELRYVQKYLEYIGKLEKVE